MPDLEPVPNWEEGWDGQDATPWLIEYVRVRLAEHFPDVRADQFLLTLLIPLVLDGLTRAPNGGHFLPHLCFDNEDEEPNDD